MKTNRVLIKLGGSSLQETNIMSDIAETVRQYRLYGYEVILVHGGGPSINQELTRRGIQWSFVRGQRVTTPEMMDAIQSVLWGRLNGELVGSMKQVGVSAAGISGVQDRILFCQQASEELGLVGAIQHVDITPIEHVLKQPGSPVPIVTPLGFGSDGEIYNINADWAASQLAIALKVSQLVFLTDQSGILNAQTNLIREISSDGLQKLIDTEVVTGGMYTKVKTVLNALTQGVSHVRILNTKDSLRGLWSDHIGTQCFQSDSQFLSLRVEPPRMPRYANI